LVPGLTYLAWEAGLAGQEDACRLAVATALQLPLVQANNLSDSLLVRTAEVLGDKKAIPVEDVLETFGRGDMAFELVNKHRLSGFPSQDEVALVLKETAPQLSHLKLLTESGDSEGIHDPQFLENASEEATLNTRALQPQLARIASSPEGQKAIETAVEAVLVDPYPRYRDIGLVAFGAVCVSAQDDGWSRLMMRQILEAGLDQEGASFTFDLPFLLVEAAQKRGLKDDQLEVLHSYCSTAWESHDRWGTSVRARAALANAHYWLGETKGAKYELTNATEQPMGYAGFATLHWLSLANRWRQFGKRNQVTNPPAGFKRHLHEAKQSAKHVKAKDFSKDREELVTTYHQWWPKSPPDVKNGLANLAEFTGDIRMAYIDHLSAIWSFPPDRPYVEGLKALLPHALSDGTTLDAVLARLCGAYLSRPEPHRLDDQILLEIVDHCNKSLTTGRPWMSSERGGLIG